jgi:hypothetical protein
MEGRSRRMVVIVPSRLKPARRPRAERVARRPTVPKFGHDRALHYLAGRQECELPDGVRYWLTQVVEGYTGRCDDGGE